MKVGLSLAGGGIRGIAHAGIIKALEENNIEIEVIGGTSSGSFVAALYAMGFNGEEILSLFKQYNEKIVGISAIPIISNFDNMFKNDFNISGIKDGETIEILYNEIAKSKGLNLMSDLKMPIAVPATNFIDSKEYVFSSLKPKNAKYNYITDITIGTAVRASSSFSGVFKPCIYKDKIFLDGGILDNVPVKAVKELGASKVIAVNFNSDAVDEKSGIMDIIMKTLDIMGNKISEENLQQADLIITVPTDGTGLLDVQKIDYCYNSGYQKGLEYIEKIKELF
mgnify:FL=1